MKTPVNLLKNGVVLMLNAIILTGCLTSPPEPVNTNGLRQTVGTDLIGTKGATKRDQVNIDLTVAGLCAGRVYTESECRRHTNAKAN